MCVLDKTNKQTKNSTFSFGGVSRTETVNNAMWLGSSWEKFESLPGCDHRLPRVIINKGEGNGRNIECVGYKENTCLLHGFSLS